MCNGDVRQGLYLGCNKTHLYIDDGLRRPIQLVMIKDDGITERKRPFEACLESE